MFTTSMSGAWASLNFFKLWKSWDGQRLKEIERLRTLFEREGLQRMSEAAKTERAERKAKAEQASSEGFFVSKKPSLATETPSDESEFNVEDIYSEALARTEIVGESQMRDSAIEYIHTFTPNNI